MFASHVIFLGIGVTGVFMLHVRDWCMICMTIWFAYIAYIIYHRYNNLLWSFWIAFRDSWPLFDGENLAIGLPGLQIHLPPRSTLDQNPPCPLLALIHLPPSSHPAPNSHLSHWPTWCPAPKARPATIWRPISTWHACSQGRRRWHLWLRLCWLLWFRIWIKSRSRSRKLYCLIHLRSVHGYAQVHTSRRRFLERGLKSRVWYIHTYMNCPSHYILWAAWRPYAL